MITINEDGREGNLMQIGEPRNQDGQDEHNQLPAAVAASGGVIIIDGGALLSSMPNGARRCLVYAVDSASDSVALHRKITPES